MGAGAFDGCEALADENGFVTLGGVCCGNITRDSDLRVPEGVCAIAPGAFREKQSLIFLTLPGSVKRVGEAAFVCCRALREIVLPGCVTELGKAPFEGCDSLISIVAPGIPPEVFDTAPERVSAALGFCRREGSYDGRSRAAYERFLGDYCVDILEAAVERNMPDALSYFTARRLIGRADFERVLEKAQRSRAMEIVALLLDYRAGGFEGGTFDKFDLDI